MSKVTLIDGTEDDSCSEAWRCECEARSALRMDLASRRSYLEDIAKKRGAAAAEKLKAVITAVWEAGRKK